MSFGSLFAKRYQKDTQKGPNGGHFLRPADDGKRFAALGVAWPYCLYKGEGFGEGWWPDWTGTVAGGFFH